MRSSLYAAIVTATLLLLACSGSPEGKAGSGRAVPGEDDASAKKPRRSASSKKSAKFPSLNIDFLFEKRAGEEKAGEERNIVAMEEDPAVVAERKRKEEEARKQAEEAAKKAAEARKKMDEEVAKNPPPPQPPAVNFDFIGYLGPAGDHIGVFRISGKEDDIVLKRKGEKIGSEFKVIEVGYETAEIGFDGFAETKVIPLVAGGK